MTDTPTRAMTMKSRPVRLTVVLMSVAVAWSGAFFAGYGQAAASYAALCVASGIFIGCLLCGAIAGDRRD